MKPATPYDNPLGLLASKAPADRLHVAVGSGASIYTASPSVERATARDGTAVQLRPLRRDEQELVARFYAGLSAESRRRRFLQPMPRLPEAMLGRLVDVDGHRHVACGCCGPSASNSPSVTAWSRAASTYPASRRRTCRAAQAPPPMLTASAQQPLAELHRRSDP